MTRLACFVFPSPLLCSCVLRGGELLHACIRARSVDARKLPPPTGLCARGYHLVIISRTCAQTHACKQPKSPLSAKHNPKTGHFESHFERITDTNKLTVPHAHGYIQYTQQGESLLSWYTLTSRLTYTSHAANALTRRPGLGAFFPPYPRLAVCPFPPLDFLRPLTHSSIDPRYTQASATL